MIKIRFLTYFSYLQYVRKIRNSMLRFETQAKKAEDKTIILEKAKKKRHQFEDLMLQSFQASDFIEAIGYYDYVYKNS